MQAAYGKRGGRHVIILDNLPADMLRDSIIITPPNQSSIRLKPIDTQYIQVP